MAASTLDSAGYVLAESFLPSEECERLLAAIDEYRSGTELPEIHRETRGRALHYSVIDGHQIHDDLPDIWALYTGPVRELMSEFSGEAMFPLSNVRAGVNVNIMPPGESEYRWHYDRTPVTAILYLNEVEGGDTELFPGLRILLSDRRWSRAQRMLDVAVGTNPIRSMRSKKVAVSPKAGRLVAMAGNRAWHSVCGVGGAHDRINIILAYDREGATFPGEDGLDAYLYTNERTDRQDPNYLG